MEFQEVVRRRRMVRNYADGRSTPPSSTGCSTNATRAPSAGFSQGWAFLVLDTPDDVRRFWAAHLAPRRARHAGCDGMMRAPVVVVPAGSKAAYLDRYAEPDKGWTDRDEARWPMPYWHMDAAMAALLILQTADRRRPRRVLLRRRPRARSVRARVRDPRPHDPVGAITLGHPRPAGAAGSPPARPRTPWPDVVHRGGW